MKSKWSQYAGMNLLIGFAVSLSLCLMAFEWKSPQPVVYPCFSPPEYDLWFCRLYQPPRRFIPAIVAVPNSQETESLDSVGLQAVIFEFELTDNNPSEEELQSRIAASMPDSSSLPETVIPTVQKKAKINLSDDFLDSLDICQGVMPDPALKDTVAGVDAPFHIIADEPAKPNGGIQGFYDYVQQNLKYPPQEVKMDRVEKVFLEFIVQKDGSLSDIIVLRGAGAACNEEAIRILQESPKWTPAKKRGQIVRQKMTFPITFRFRKE